MSSKENCRNELRTAIRQLSDGCLYAASKWAAEQLVGIEQDPAKFTPANTRFHTNESASTPISGVLYVSTPVMEEDEVVDGDFYLLAKIYFDSREYKRAALYLAGEKQKEEEMIELEGPLGKRDAVNRKLVALEREISRLQKNAWSIFFGFLAA